MTIVAPTVTPVTMPVAEPTLATVAALLIQWPPVVASVNVLVAVPHMLNMPAIVPGSAFIVTGRLTLHPVTSLYVIVDVPANTPATTPVPDPIAALAGALLIHVPPDVPSVSVAVAPAQIAGLPAIAAGIGFTVIVR